jgi:hypothetical protein
MDSAGNPVVAWRDKTGGDDEIYLRAWDGAMWIELGGSATGGGMSATTSDSKRPAVALEPGTGYPVVAWDENVSDGEIYLRRWDGGQWVELGGSASGGGISNTSGESREVSLALDTSGNPVVAWENDGNGQWEIYVRRWNGSSWVEVGTGSASGVGISGDMFAMVPIASRRPSVALNAAGHPIVAWEEIEAGDSEVYVLAWDGGSWVGLGGSAMMGGMSANGGTSTWPSLQVDGNDVPMIAWQDSSGGSNEIFVRFWDVGTWSPVGAGADGGNGISNSSGSARRPSLGVR